MIYVMEVWDGAEWIVRPVFHDGLPYSGNVDREPVVTELARIRKPGQKWRINLRSHLSVEKELGWTS